MSVPFDFSMPTRLVWGVAPEDAIVDLATEFGASRVLIVTDPGVVATGLPERVREALEAQGHTVGVMSEVEGNPTTDDVARAEAAASDHAAELVVAIGGGSVIDTAKAAAMLLTNGGRYSEYQWEGRPILHRSHPLVAVPTTAGTGSEVSRVAVISDPAEPFKKGVLSPLMFAHAAVLDPEVTVGLPPRLTAATGVDALVHALEAYTGRRANPLSDLFARESLRLAFTHIETATAHGDDRRARAGMLLAAVYGGIAMDQAGLGLVHALSGGICAHLHLHHGSANAMILPHALEFNVGAIAPDRRRDLAVMAGLDADASPERLVAAVTGLVQRLGLSTTLAGDVAGLRDVDWAAVAASSMRMVMIGNNPRPVSYDDCAAVLSAMRAEPDPVQD